MKAKKPRVNKTKSEIAADIQKEAKIARMVALVKLMWPFVESLDRIYDAQTAFNAIAGYTELGLKLREEQITVGDLAIDLSKEEDTKIKRSMVDLLGLLEKENARDVVVLTRKVADMLGQFGANEFLKGPMDKIKVTDLVT